MRCGQGRGLYSLCCRRDAVCWPCRCSSCCEVAGRPRPPPVGWKARWRTRRASTSTTPDCRLMWGGAELPAGAGVGTWLRPCSSAHGQREHLWRNLKLMMSSNHATLMRATGSTVSTEQYFQQYWAVLVPAMISRSLGSRLTVQGRKVRMSLAVRTGVRDDRKTSKLRTSPSISSSGSTSFVVGMFLDTLRERGHTDQLTQCRFTPVEGGWPLTSHRWSWAWHGQGLRRSPPGTGWARTSCRATAPSGWSTTPGGPS